MIPSHVPRGRVGQVLYQVLVDDRLGLQKAVARNFPGKQKDGRAGARSRSVSPHRARPIQS
jgi:hypothetical protein